MKVSTAVLVLCPIVILLGAASRGSAKPPWTSLLPFKRIEADPNKEYSLSEENGPWLILAASFAGEGAERQARELVLELRRRYKLPAYLHRQHYDYTDTLQGLTYDKYGERMRMKYAHGGRYDALAVLIGDFAAIDDPALEQALERVKYAEPECLDLSKRNWSTQHFIGLRELYRRVNGDQAKRSKGAMGSAFATRNPLLPREYFSPQGPDDFVLELNRGLKYSLLDNPGKYSVRVATFRGERTINQREIAELEDGGRISDKLERAAAKAERLTAALRKRGVEAYQFHDRHESIVTVGSFESDGTPLPDGTVKINPAIHQIMKTYGAQQRPLPGQGVLGLQPTQLGGISFDVQPVPIAVPRRSIAQDYARRGLPLFR